MLPTQIIVVHLKQQKQKQKLLLKTTDLQIINFSTATGKGSGLLYQ